MIKGVLVLLCALLAASAQSGDWPVAGGFSSQNKYSPLTQINRDNVSQLRVAWTYDSGDDYPESEIQCNPIVVNGVLYATTPRLRLIALDAATGKLRWSFDPGLKGRGKLRNRGVAWWTDGKSARIFYGVRDYLYAIDAKTGKPATGFGRMGRVGLRENLGRDPRSQSVGLNSPPVIYRDLVIIGSVVSETLPASPGDIRAYDARTGALRWSFHTIPHPGEFGYETWPKDAWTYAGGANNWTGMALDAARGLVFVPTGSASFDFYGGNRTGDNLFANCLIALKAETGERVWHFQTVRHDLWDRDLPAPPTLVTVRREGRDVDAVAVTTKSGYVFLFERETGKPLFPIREREAPGGGVEGEHPASRQPVPEKPEPFARQRLTEELVTRRTPAAREDVLGRLRKARSEGQFAPPSFQGTVVFPGFDGGAEWGGSAFDKDSGLLYVNANEMAWILRIVKAEPVSDARGLYKRECASCHRSDFKGTPPEFPALTGLAGRYDAQTLVKFIKEGGGRMPGFDRLGDEALLKLANLILSGEDSVVDLPPQPIEQRFSFDGYNKLLDPDGYPGVAPPWGTLSAINLNTGDFAWKIPLGEYPELAAQGIPTTGSENYGGPVITAGGLLFIGATIRDDKFRAFDKATGKLLWETKLPAGGSATPAVYQAGGREFVVIAAGGGKWGAASGGKYVAFALPK